MLNQFSREEILIGSNNVKKLNNSKVVIFGIGGVGSYVVEGLARCGIGNFILVDNDDVSLTNINRQLIALHSNIGKSKVDVAKDRILEIYPEAKVEVRKDFFLPNSEDFFDSSIDYIIDAIDTISTKIELVLRAKNHNIPIISSMGTGNKFDPTKLEVSDIYDTSICPLAKVMRKELKNRGVEELKVVYSKELPINIDKNTYNKFIEEEKSNNSNSKSNIPGSMSFVPSVCGLIIASEVVKDIIGINKKVVKSKTLLKKQLGKNYKDNK